MLDQVRKRVRVLFVCMGNICRSPTAEGVFRKLVQDYAPHLDVEIDSAGTHAYHVGEAPDHRAVSAAADRGYDLTTIRARGIQDSDFESFDYVLAMDEDNKALLLERCPEQYRGRVRLFLEFHEGAVEQNVPDPYYGSVNGFEHVLDLVVGASRGFLKELEKASGSTD